MTRKDAQLESVERWRDEALDVPLWHERTDHMIALLARHLRESGEARSPLSLLDLGCGAMAAERSLARHGLTHVTYVPADCFARDARTRVIDLDDLAAVRLLPRADVLFLGGVLEYLREPAAVLQELARRARILCFSYCPRVPGQAAAARRGWKNHFTETEMERLARSLGSRVEVDSSFDARAPKPVRCYLVVTGTPAHLSCACPLCGEDDAETGHVGELPLEAVLVRQETRVCRRCGLTFEVSEPDQDWAGLYGTAWQRGAFTSECHRALYADDARRIGPGHGRRAFDIGCGSGFLLDELQKLGWRTAGCDPERAAAELALRSGHEVRAELFTPREEWRADLVILGDVLEHQAEPLPFLASVRRVVLPEGRFYVRVPDLAAIDFDSFGDVFGLQHRVWFTRETLREMLAAAGFEPESAGSHGVGGRGQHALARLAEPRPARRPAGEPQRSLELVRLYSRGLAARRGLLGERLARLAGRTVALYGAGEHARELLAFSPLGGIASRVVDGNPALWGADCGGRTVEPPARLRSDPPESIVIASRAYQDEITAELADLERRGVELVSLYPRSG